MDYTLPHFTIDFRDWIKGNNRYDNYPDGGLLASETGFNPFAYPGLLMSQAAWPTSSITGSLKRAVSIGNALNNDGNAYGAFSFISMAKDGDPDVLAADGYFYETNPTTGAMSAFHTTTATVKKHRLGWSEIESVGNYAIATSDTNLTFLDPAASSPSDVQETWGTSNGMAHAMSASNPHPMGRFEEFVYVGDGQYLHQIDVGALTAVDRYFTHIPDRYIPTALVQHRGYLLIACTYYYTAALALGSKPKTITRILLWDGFSQSFADDILIDDPVTAMVRATDGIVYIWTVNYFGYLDGSTFRKLRRLENKVYKHMVINIPDGLMYADGAKLVTYRSVIPGAKKYFFITDVLTQNVMSIAQALTDTPIVFTDKGSSGSGKNLLYSPLDSGTGGTKTFEFNKRVTRVPVKVRGIVIETEGLGSPGSVTVKYYDSTRTLRTVVGNLAFTSADVPMAAKRRWCFDVSGNSSTTVISPVVTITGGAKLRSIDFYYERAEVDSNK